MRFAAFQRTAHRNWRWYNEDMLRANKKLQGQRLVAPFEMQRQSVIYTDKYLPVNSFMLTSVLISLLSSFTLNLFLSLNLRISFPSVRFSFLQIRDSYVSKSFPFQLNPDSKTRSVYLEFCIIKTEPFDQHFLFSLISYFPFPF